MLRSRLPALALVASLSIPAASGAAARPTGVDLLAAGPGVVRIGVTVPEPALVASDSTSSLRRLQLPGWTLDGAPGSVPLPVRIVRVAVPIEGPVNVRAFGITSGTREGVALAPAGVAPPGTTGSSGLHLAPERARLVSVSWMRNQRVAAIAITPVDYEPGVKRLTFWSRIEIEVGFAPATATVTPFERVDPFEGAYASVLLNYEQGKSWRRPASGALARLPSSAALARTTNVTVDTSSIFAGHTWVKIAIPKSGFYRINYGQLRQLAPFAGVDSISYDRLRLYAWPGRPVLSESTPCDQCDYRQVALSPEDKTTPAPDNLLDSNADSFSFYALGPSDWANHYDPSFGDTTYIQNPYSNENFYFLSFDHAPRDRAFSDAPLRIASNSDDVTPHPTGGENLPTSFRERIRFELDSGNEYFPSIYPYSRVDGPEPWAWAKFMWRSIGMSGTFSTALRTPSPLAATPAYVRTRTYGTAFNVNETCSPSQTPHILDAVVQSPAGYDSARADYFDTQAATLRLFPVLDSVNIARLRIPNPGPGCRDRVDQSTLDWIEAYYRRRFVPEGDELTFDSPGNGNAIYTIGRFSAGTLPRMYDITDPFVPREMKSESLATFVADSSTLRIEVNEVGPRRYTFVPDLQFLKPAATDLTEASADDADDLRSPSHAADYIVIYYDAFKLAADSLVAWRTVHLPNAAHAAPYHAVEVPISAIYDQFSGGRTDPVAIRLFLRAAFFNWHAGSHPAPEYVTLLGDASFDFKNQLALAREGDPGSLLPSFEDNWVAGTQYSSDDWLLNVDDAVDEAIPDFIGGRIPADDANGALAFVRNKLLFYERSAPTGEWRNRVMLIADDDQQGEQPDQLEWTHVSQTAALDTLYTPAHVDRAYVYLHTYPDGPGRTKPGAKADIKNIINGDGVVMFNYVGHGSPFKLSDEDVLIDTDAGSFVNASKPPLFVSASCDVGKFNDPRVQSLGERLLFGASGGTVAVISASELAYSFLNYELNTTLYTNLFDRSVASGQYWEPVGTALLAAKLTTSNGDFNIHNNQKYNLLGDAALKLDLPQLWVDVSIDDETGTTPVSELKGGQTLTCKGRVLDRPGGSPVPYSGLVDLLIEDSKPRQTTPPCVYDANCARSDYDFRAGAIFRGSLLVQGGSFSGKFVVPLEANGGPHGRVRAYVQGLPSLPPQTDGVGSQRLQISPGTAPAGDQSGPTVSLSFPGGVTSVKPDAVLNIELSDPSGILTTGHTVQNGIIVTVDDNTTARTDVTSSFHYAANSYTTGTASFTLPNLAPGSHTVAVSAADNLAGGLTAFQHRSTASLAFEVATAPPISIRNAYLFPNPTESGRRLSGGTFVVDGPGDSANVMVRLFTISGRLIRELKSFGTFGQIQVRWDGLDAEGYPLANGTYLFKVYVNGRDASGKSSAREKAAHEGRFVILNH